MSPIDDSPAGDEALVELERALERRENILGPEAWDEIVRTMQRHVPFARAAVTLRDGPSHYRLYAISRGPGYDFAPFQQRLPVLPHTDEIVYRRGEPYFCDDTREGSLVEQMIAFAGYHSYTLVPMRDERGVFGDVLFAFDALGAARAAPMDRLLGFTAAIARVIPRALDQLHVHRLAHILEHAEEALLAWDGEGTVIEANPAAERLFGRAREELLGRAVEELLGGGPPEQAGAASRRRTLTRPDGSRVVVSTTVARGEGDPLVAGHAFLRDLRDVVLAEERLVQADRLATLGMLAAGVAHEINNPAAFLLLGLDLLRRRVGAASAGDELAVADIEGLLGELRESTQRIVTIARDLRHFATPGGGSPVVVDVASAVDSALSLARAQILERADLEVDVARDLPPVLVEEGRLSQVLVNLLINAVQSIPKGLGRAVVRVQARASGSLVVVEVADTGVGLAPEVIERMWNPFFTTKAQGHGTGLGLSISRGIVEKAGGSIRAINGSGLRPEAVGARFVVELPAAGAAHLATVSSAPPPASRPVRRTVLIVEDEPSLARALVEQVGAVHDVTLVARGDDAVRILVSRRFDVVLCDLRMPGLSGEAVYQRVAVRDPDQASRFVFMTGVGFGEETERFLAAAGVPLLEKPFEVVELLRMIAKIGVRPPDVAAG